MSQKSELARQSSKGDQDLAGLTSEVVERQQLRVDAARLLSGKVLKAKRFRALFGAVERITVDGPLTSDDLEGFSGETSLIARIVVGGGRLSAAFPITVEWRRDHQTRALEVRHVTPHTGAYEGLVV